MDQLAFGTAPIGGMFMAVSDEQAASALEKAWDLGIRNYDTAPLYGLGSAEERLGRMLRTKPRDAFTISTKVGRVIRTGVQPSHDISAWIDAGDRVPVFDFSYDGVMRSLEESLGRLGLDRVDVLYIHDPDDHYDVAIDGAYRALTKLREDGVVASVGVGMNQHEMLSRFASDGSFDRFLLAGRYTLLEQGAEGFLDRCAERGLAVTCGGVFNSGLLADPRPGITYNYAPAPESLIARAIAIRDVCSDHGVDIKTAALRFPLMHPAVTTVLTGVRTADELAENVALFDADIPSELWDELRSIGLLR